MSGGDSFFTKVTHRADRERVYNMLVEHKIEILAVDEKKESYKLFPRFLTGSKMVLAPAAGLVRPSGSVIITFNVGSEKYFLKVPLEEGRGSDLHLDMQTDLFKLQRRGSFRLNIPTGYVARLDLKKKNDAPAKEKHEIVDLSGGGLAFELPVGGEAPYKKGDILEGRLVVGPEFEAEVSGVVRHARMVGSKGSGLCRVGVEFQKLRPAVENEIVKLVMDLHRDMFSKFKLGSR